MKYKVGDKVRIKSIDWYNKNKDEISQVDCGSICFISPMVAFCGQIVTISSVQSSFKVYHIKEDGGIFSWTDEMIEIKPKFSVGDIIAKAHLRFRIVKVESDNYIVEEMPGINLEILFKDQDDYILVKEGTKSKDMGEVSDGCHTFNELYEYRMLYNAALFNEFAKQGLYDVHKSRKHSDGKYPFDDSNWFIVMAELPTGQISNHYEMKDWDKFQIPEKPLANKWDEHSPKDVTNRLISFTTPKKEYPKTYTICRYILRCDINNCIIEGYKSELLNNFQKLLICRDAYWKIAGEEMELRKPWEPTMETVYCISRNDNVIKCSYRGGKSNILEFPTSEMRDAFYNNFKELIEFCKELL